MVNWTDSEVELFCLHLSFFVAVVTAGYYACDFFLSCRFDWDCYQGRRPRRWALIPYFIARYTCLVALLLAIRVSNVFGPVDDCNVWWRSIYGFACTATACASLLLVLRTIALWGSKPWIWLVTIPPWLAIVGTSIHGVITIESENVPRLFVCGLKNTVTGRARYVSYVATDFLCLLLCMLALYRERGLGFWSLLMSQGQIYFAVIVVAYIPNLVILWLDLNDGINEIFQPATMIAVVICATRMYRAIVKYNPSAAPSYALSTHAEWSSSRRPDRSVIPASDFAATDGHSKIISGHVPDRGSTLTALEDAKRKSLDHAV